MAGQLLGDEVVAHALAEDGVEAQFLRQGGQRGFGHAHSQRAPAIGRKDHEPAGLHDVRVRRHPKEGRQADHVPCGRTGHELVEVRPGVGGRDLLGVVDVVQGKILPVDGEIEPGHAFGVFGPEWADLDFLAGFDGSGVGAQALQVFLSGVVMRFSRGKG